MIYRGLMVGSNPPPPTPPPLAVKFTFKKWLKKTSNPLPKPEKMSWSAHASYFKSFKRNTLRVHNYDSCHVLWLVPWSCYHIDNLHFWMENTENKILLTFCKLCKQKQDPNFVYNAKKIYIALLPIISSKARPWTAVPFLLENKYMQVPVALELSI